MVTFDNILRLLEESGKSQKELADHIGVAKSRITDWKSGRVNSYTKYLPQIAEFLSVSVDSLIGKTPDPLPTESPARLGDIEQELLNICRSLTMQQKNSLLTKAYEMRDSNK